MKPTVYVESSVVSYLTARAGRDIVTAARQAITQDWWQNRNQFEVVVSVLVEIEVSAGDHEAAQARLDVIKDIPRFGISEEAERMAQRLLESGSVPVNCEEDALHIGIAAANGADYLLTWNFKHINNAQTKRDVVQTILDQGFRCPILCSPEELGDSHA